jgi:biotin carboxyl carrier protein
MIAKHSRCCAALLLSIAAGCQRVPSPAAPAAEKPRAEAELSRTTISRAAQQSLGIKTTPVRVEKVQEQRILTGWVTIPPGSEVTVTAPVGGYLRAPAPPALLPAPGLPVRPGQELFRLEPVLAPLEQTQLAALRRGIESDLAKAREHAALADNELKRVDTLFKQKLRGDRDVEQAKLAVNVAQEEIAAALDKLRVITAPGADKGDFRPAPLTLTAPRAGMVLSLLANPGQFVAAAAPLVSIADVTRPWLRVPLPEYELPHVDRSRPAHVTLGPLSMQADPVALVPQVDPIKHTADLFYELKPGSTSMSFAKDQMLTVAVPVGGRSEASVVPYASILFDAYGGTWVYIERTAKDAVDCVYERMRVELGAALGDDVAVRPALKAGDAVVSEGAAALFSREFYRPPVAVPETPKGK